MDLQEEFDPITGKSTAVEVDMGKAFVRKKARLLSELNDLVRSGTYRSVLGAVVLLLVGFSAWRMSGFLLNNSTDNRSQASGVLVDMEVLASETEFVVGESVEVPIVIYPNESQVSGVVLQVAVSDPSVGEIRGMRFEGSWGQVVRESLTQGEGRMEIVSKCTADGCSKLDQPGVLVVLSLQMGQYPGSVEINLAGSQVSAVNGESNMVGELVGARLSVVDGPAPSPSPTPSASDTEAPVVTIVSPGTGETLDRSGDLQIEVDASDNVGVSRVDVSVYGKVYCTLETAPYLCSVRLRGKPNDVIEVLAVGFDEAGNKGSDTVGVVTSR